jgi:hypothetical protein
MRKCRLFIVLAALVFVFPVSALSWDDEPEADSGPVSTEASEAEAWTIETLKDDRVLALEEAYAAEIQAILEQIQEETDPLEREHLQREIHELKAEEAIALKELFLEIAFERGDWERVDQLQEALDKLYYPEVAEPADDETQQPVKGKSVGRTRSQQKNPDDA